MAAIGASSIIFSAGLLLAFLAGPRADMGVLTDAGLVLIGLGFAGLFAALLLGSQGPPPRQRTCGTQPAGRRPRPY